jgi:hypothetical protein
MREADDGQSRWTLNDLVSWETHPLISRWMSDALTKDGAEQQTAIQRLADQGYTWRDLLMFDAINGIIDKFRPN